MVSSYSSYNSSEEMSQANSYLHKTSGASKINKKPNQPSSLAPSTRALPKVYKVKPIHFRELVQQLTGAPPGLVQKQPRAQIQSQAQAQARRSSLQSIAPPALPLHNQPSQNQSVDMGVVKQEQAPPAHEEKQPMFGGFDSTTELTLSPNFQAWFSFAMLSPVSQMEQRAVV